MNKVELLMSFSVGIGTFTGLLITRKASCLQSLSKFAVEAVKLTSGLAALSPVRNTGSSRPNRTERDADDLSNILNRGFALWPHDASDSAIQEPLDNDTGSTYNLELADIWLRTCVNTQFCLLSWKCTRRSTTTPYSSNRRSRSGSTKTPRDFQGTSRVLTLSYC